MLRLVQHSHFEKLNSQFRKTIQANNFINKIIRLDRFSRCIL